MAAFFQPQTMPMAVDNVHFRPPAVPRSSSASLVFPQSATMQNLTAHKHSSRTWTTSSGELALMSDTDELEDRALFVQEYNRLAKKHGVRILIIDDFASTKHSRALEKRSWLYRVLRNSPPPVPPKPRNYTPRHRRSVSDLAHNLLHARDLPKSFDLQSMVRASGKSVLYLPQDYSPSSLVLPTCLRAIAQYLAQHASTRGIFRIPGSIKVVNALFDHYCYMENGGVDIASTVRCANLPMHIEYSVHDVASTFKRLLSVLPGGILGSLSIFDALVAIHSNLNGDPEFPRTKQTKVRARLLALALGTIESQFRRELICAVFGLLSLVGRLAEVAPREDENRRPLPTADLMGYSALGIVFGPLLVGDLLEHYTMKLATPASGLLLFPLSPTKLQRGRRKSRSGAINLDKPPTVNKIYIANSITEMLLTNWRDIVRQMKALGTHHRQDVSSSNFRPGSLRASASETFIAGTPKDWRASNREGSPDPYRLPLGLQRQRPRNRTRPRLGANILSPTVEENGLRERQGQGQFETVAQINPLQLSPQRHDLRRSTIRTVSPCTDKDLPLIGPDTSAKEPDSVIQQARRKVYSLYGSPEVSIDDVPPRTSSIPQDTPRSHMSPERRSLQASPVKSHHLKTEVGESSQSQSFDLLEPIKPLSPVRPHKDEGNAACTKAGGVLSDTVSHATLEEQVTSMPFYTALNDGGNAENFRNAHDTSSTTDGSQSLHHVAYLRPSDDDIDRHFSFLAPEPISRTSIDTTPRRFYPTPTRLDGSKRPLIVLTQDNIASASQRFKQEPLMTKLQSSETVANRASMSSARTTGSHPERKTAVLTIAAMFEDHDGAASTPSVSLGSRPPIMDISSDVPVACTPCQRSIDVLAGTQSPSRIPVLARNKRHNFSTSSNENEPIQQSLRATETSGLQPFSSSDQPPVPLSRSFESHLGQNDPQHVPNLGTMIPHREHPPVASHLHLARQPSSVSFPRESDDMSEGTTPMRPLSAASVLHSQIRHLQKQLQSKTEEAVQLRRQCEAQKDSDVGTLSEQLREAKREAQTWQERAHAAEKRVKVFERFTSRLKGMRDSAERRSTETGQRSRDDSLPRSGPQHLRSLRDELVDAGEARSTVSGQTENIDLPGDVHSMTMCNDGAADEVSLTMDGVPTRRLPSLDVMEIWMAAQELLEETDV